MENLLSILPEKTFLFLTVVFLIFLFIQYLAFKRKIKKKDTIIQENLEKISQLEKEIEEINQQLEETNKEKELIRIRYEAIIPEAKEKAKTIIENAKAEAQTIINDARFKAKHVILRAYEVSEMITEEAYENARSISSEVFEKLDKIQELEKTIQAYENIIKNYDYEFTFKESIILDELAEVYSYTEAGKKLKEAREKTKELVQTKRAAVSDYVEDNRKNTAINFIVDAFNGKVDSIMTRIRHDNYDKLKQQIIDAYYLVNNLGSAFRNTRITKEYLEARLDELKWGAIIAEIRRKEREEQRRIREQMREEEKARRERERAIEEAKKEEEMLQKAIEKVKTEMLAAAEAEKEKLKIEMEKLKQKLKEAEEKSQRAISMAQKTKAGHVYIISNIGSFGENVYKVGMTRRLDPMDRIRELGDASVPFPFDVHAIIYSEDAPALENKLHNFLEEKRINKVNPRKEFFRVTLKEIKDFLEKEGIEAQWTMKAEAAEYRESLAIEERLKNKYNAPSKDLAIKS